MNVFVQSHLLEQQPQTLVMPNPLSFGHHSPPAFLSHLLAGLVLFLTVLCLNDQRLHFFQGFVLRPLVFFLSILCHDLTYVSAFSTWLCADESQIYTPAQTSSLRVTIYFIFSSISLPPHLLTSFSGLPVVLERALGSLLWLKGPALPDHRLLLQLHLTLLPLPSTFTVSVWNALLCSLFLFICFAS